MSLSSHNPSYKTRLKLKNLKKKKKYPRQGHPKKSFFYLKFIVQKIHRKPVSLFFIVCKGAVECEFILDVENGRKIFLFCHIKKFE